MSILQSVAAQSLAQGVANAAQASRFLIGGHRGVGENLINERCLESPNAVPPASCVIPKYRENTVTSFCRAAELGVDFIEFDVQVTSDGVPVIWHDDTVLQQQLSSQQVTATTVKDMPLASFQAAAGGAPSSSGTFELVRHFRGVHSRQPLPQQILPWVCEVQDHLPTLQEVFTSVPEKIVFDLEIKMTEPPTVAHTPPEEVERIVNSIWEVVKQHVSDVEALPLPEGGAPPGYPTAGGPPAGYPSADGPRVGYPSSSGAPTGAVAMEAALTGAVATGPLPRTVFFSSFDPDVCEAIRLKQGICDVWFLSGCGLYEHADPRRTSIAAALAFAQDKHLTGIVLPVQVLLDNESIVQEAAATGLRLMTYGLKNNDSDAISRQEGLGINGVIVDDVEGLMSARRGTQAPAGMPPSA